MEKEKVKEGVRWVLFCVILILLMISALYYHTGINKGHIPKPGESMLVTPESLHYINNSRIGFFLAFVFGIVWVVMYLEVWGVLDRV